MDFMQEHLYGEYLSNASDMIESEIEVNFPELYQQYENGEIDHQELLEAIEHI